MSYPKRVFRLLVAIAAVGGGFAPPLTSGAQCAFHHIFGTTGDPERRDADGAAFIVEAAGGDFVVAGSGASYSTDDGRRYSNPMAARFDARGGLKWQRVYTDLANHRIVALATDGEAEYALLERAPDLQAVLRSGAAGALTLHRIDEQGDASAALATLEDFRFLAAGPAFEAESSHFLVAGGQSTGVRILRVGPHGEVANAGFAAGLDRIQQMKYLDEHDFVVSRWVPRERLVDGRPVAEMHTEVLRLRSNGETELLLRVPNTLCHHVAAALSRIACLEVPLLRTDDSIDFIVAYAEGREVWRHALERGIAVEYLDLLESGEVIYAYRAAASGWQDAVVSVLGADGAPQWERSVRSAGPFTFLSAIAQLEDGRWALLGSTGPWDGFVSADTDAIVIVADVAAGDVEALEIVSDVVDLQSGSAPQ